MREFVSRRDEGATVRGIEGAVTAVRCNNQLGFRPRTMKRPGTLHGTDDIITALHNYSWNMPNLRGVFEQLRVGLHKTPINEIMCLDARKRQGELVLFVVCREGNIRKKLRSRTLPFAPDLCRSEADSLIVAGQAAIVRRE